MVGGKNEEKRKKEEREGKREKRKYFLSASFGSHRKLLNFLGTKLSYFFPQKGGEKEGKEEKRK